jgi:hypothetical protein
MSGGCCAFRSESQGSVRGSRACTLPAIPMPPSEPHACATSVGSPSAWARVGKAGQPAEQRLRPPHIAVVEPHGAPGADRSVGLISVNTKPSRSTTSPTATVIGTRNIGPAGWPSAPSPTRTDHIATSDGRREDAALRQRQQYFPLVVALVRRLSGCVPLMRLPSD